MSTVYKSEDPIQFEKVLRISGIFISKQGTNGPARFAWLHLGDLSPSSLCMWRQPDGSVSFERYGQNCVGPILQVLSDQLNTTFTCELGLEKIIPGGEGEPPEGFHKVDP